MGLYYTQEAEVILLHLRGQFKISSALFALLRLNWKEVMGYEPK